jgi:hypothetical protein
LTNAPTDADIDFAINAYEQRHRLMLTPSERASLRILVKQQPTEKPRKSLHPLGHAANPAEDQTTPENRADVRACLRAYYAGTLADQINQHQDAATGMVLADRLVTLLEIGTSLKMLGMHREDMEWLLERRYRLGWSVLEVCQDEKYTQATFHRRETEAIDSLIAGIYRDFVESSVDSERSIG